MSKEMLINVSEGEECRIAILEDGKLEELYMERTSSTSHVGNIYKGRVTNVEPSIQAAFVDFGLGRNGFLHISDLMPTYFGRKGEDIQETVGRKMARRDRPPIQRCLRRGDDIIVQIIKEGIGTKGPTLTTYLSVPGKILVMMPGMGNSGVSRKIEDDDERRRLRQILDSLEPPEDAGFIIRTAGIGSTKTEIQRDLTYLARLWMTFKKKRDSGPGPMELYTEGDLVTRTVRDVFTSDVDKLIIDNKDVAKRVKEVIKLSSPRTKNKVELYEDPIPLFSKYGVEKEIELMYSRHVPLPSGGSLVIDSTEAIVAIDVNSGKNRANADAETTAFKVDMEAADEICRQLKLRDLGGVIICDFIDLRYERHRRDLEKRLDDNLKNDRAKTKVLRMSQFGIIEMTRQRMRPSLKRSVYFDCPHCKGAGLVKTPESMSLDVMRRLRIAINDLKVQRLELAACPDVAFYLQNKKRVQLGELEQQYEKRIVIRADAQLGLDEMKIDLYDGRDGLVFLEQLGMVPQPPHTTQLGTKPQPFPQRGRAGRDERGRGGRRPEPQRPATSSRNQEDEQDDDDRFDRVDAQYEEEEDREQEPDRAQEPQTREQPQARRDEPRGRQEPGRHEPGRGRNEPPRGGGRDRQPPHVHRTPPRPIDRDEVETPSLETEAGSEAADPTEAVAGQGQGEGGEEGGPRRRRRRRGRRGRGRNRQNLDGQQQPASNGHPAQAADNGEFDTGESVVEEDDVEGDDAGNLASEHVESSTHSRSRRPEPEVSDPEESSEAEPMERAADEAPEVTEEEPADKKPRRRRRGGRGRGKGKKAAATETSSEEETATPPVAPRPEPEPEPVVVVRTGSTDRHLIEDEPAFPQPVRRPRSVRDLDSIPDDFD
jgi:ribonuclease E